MDPEHQGDFFYAYETIYRNVPEKYRSKFNDKNTKLKILKFCDLDWDEKCLSPEKNSKTPIKTVSIAQARQPIYKSSLNNSTNFDKHLSKMFNILKS